MNFNMCVRQLRNGMAAKPNPWAGYVMRMDDQIPNYDSTAVDAYFPGSVVIYMSSAYRLDDNIPEGVPAGPFDKSKWRKLSDIPHYLIFIERGNPKTEYMFAAVVDGEKTSYSLSGEMQMDGALLTAFASDEWEIAAVADFESARTGTGRW